VAVAFAEQGDRVAVHHRDSSAEAHDVAAALRGDGHVVVQADLGDSEAVRRMVDSAAGALGGLDVVVNNAGLYVEHDVLATTYDEWRAAWSRTLDVNLVGPANVAWCAVRHMAGDGAGGDRAGRPSGGRIINVSSRGAFRGEPRHPAYGASKAGLNALGQSLAVALAPHGIAVATVAPGFVETAMARPALSGAAGDAVRAQSPFNRVARAEEIAAAIVYLASPQAEWASGGVLDLNGASYLRT
jgi:3-oxoacyl-[acyl-carrier protein] reductase